MVNRAAETIRPHFASHAANTRREAHPIAKDPSYRRRGDHRSPARTIAGTLRPQATPSVSRLRREPARGRHGRREGAWGRVVSVVRPDNKYSAKQDSPTTWISSIPGSLARELPKAEGVAFRRSAIAMLHKSQGVAFHTHQNPNSHKTPPPYQKISLIYYLKKGKDPPHARMYALRRRTD